VDEKFLGEIAVGIKQRQPMALEQMLNDHIPQQSCFSRTRFSNHVGVMTGVGRRKAKGDFVSPVFAQAEHDHVLVHDGRLSRHSRPRRKVSVSNETQLAGGASNGCS
jgi:hypothetical protein